MIVTELGYTKRSKVSQFETQRRGGKGVTGADRDQAQRQPIHYQE